MWISFSAITGVFQNAKRWHVKGVFLVNIVGCINIFVVVVFCFQFAPIKRVTTKNERVLGATENKVCVQVERNI